MEPNKPEKGSLISAFRKAVLVAVAGVALGVGVSTEAKAQSTVPYGNQGVTATQQQVKPWASNAAYRETIRLFDQEQYLDAQKAEQRAKVDLAKIQQQRTQRLATHTRKLSSLRDRKGTNALDYANVVAQWTAQEQAFKSRTEQVYIRLQQLNVDQQTARTEMIERLDRQYSRQEPYKSMQQGGAQVQTVRATTTAPAANTNHDQKMQEDMDKARRDAMQKLYKQYLDAEVKAGRVPDSAEDFFRKQQEAQQRQQQQQKPATPARTN